MCHSFFCCIAKKTTSSSAPFFKRFLQCLSESVNQGVTAYVEGIRGFIPASQLALDYVEDTTGFVGKTLEVRVITVDSD